MCELSRLGRLSGWLRCSPFVTSYRQLFNQIRPHEAIGMRRPLHLHLEAINDPQTTKPTEPETLPTS